jgi:hypothetical protein
MEEVVVSENERGGTRLPTFHHRRIRSEVQVPGGQRGREEERSGRRTEGRQRSHSREPSFLGEARKKRRVEELEKELRLLKESDKKGEQHRRRRTRSHSVRVKAHTVFLAIRSAMEDQTMNTKGPCPPRDAGTTTLEHLPLGTSATQSGGNSSRFHSPPFRPK